MSAYRYCFRQYISVINFRYCVPNVYILCRLYSRAKFPDTKITFRSELVTRKRILGLNELDESKCSFVILICFFARVWQSYATDRD